MHLQSMSFSIQAIVLGLGRIFLIAECPALLFKLLAFFGRLGFANLAADFVGLAVQLLSFLQLDTPAQLQSPPGDLLRTAHPVGDSFP